MLLPLMLTRNLSHRLSIAPLGIALLLVARMGMCESGILQLVRAACTPYTLSHDHQCKFNKYCLMILAYIYITDLGNKSLSKRKKKFVHIPLLLFRLFSEYYAYWLSVS